MIREPLHGASHSDASVQKQEQEQNSPTPVAQLSEVINQTFENLIPQKTGGLLKNLLDISDNETAFSSNNGLLKLNLDMVYTPEVAIAGLGVLQDNDNPPATQNGRLMTYNGSWIGPTLIADQGDRLDLSITNQLDDQTNFHSHGLHVSPLGYADNVLITIDPQETWNTVIDIPEDHFSGTNWYHPHLHGKTNEQVQGGLSGLLVIDPEEELKNYTGLENAHLEIFGLKTIYYDQTRSNQDAGIYKIANFTRGNDGLIQNAIYTVNEQYNPTVLMNTGEWEVWTMANLGNNSWYNLKLVDETGKNAIPFYIIGNDGDSGEIQTPSETDTIFVPPGKRFTVLARVPEAGTYYLLNNGSQAITPLHSETIRNNYFDLLTPNGYFDDGFLKHPQAILATVEVTGQPAPAEVALPQRKENSPPSLGSELLEAIPTQYRQLEFKTQSKPEGGKPDFLINGKVWPNVPLIMPMLDTVEEWKLVNASAEANLLEWHPFHIHQNDFTIKSINDVELSKLSDFVRDTVALPPAYQPGTSTEANPFGTPQVNGKPTEVVIRMGFEDFPGTYVYHCHILDHEDSGMMGTVRVILNTQKTWIADDINPGESGRVTLYNAANRSDRSQLLPFGENYQGGINTAIGDINRDNITDIVMVQASGNNPIVTVYDGASLTPLKEFLPFTGEVQVSVAVGDINGDGFGDVIAASQQEVIIYNGQNNSVLHRQQNPFGVGYQGEVRVTSGDVTGDNFDDVILAQGVGGTGRIWIYDGLGLQENSQVNPVEYQPFGENFQGALNVSTGYLLAEQSSLANLIIATDFSTGNNQVQIATFNNGEGHGASHSEKVDPHFHADTQFMIPGQVDQISGTFADLNTGRGQPVLMYEGDNNSGLVKLNETNQPLFDSGAFIDGSGIVLYGRSGSNNLEGSNGNDTLYGGKSSDTLNGGAGDDFLFGDHGSDVLTGGQGRDTFVLSGELIRDNTTGLVTFLGGLDTITDFELGIDLIQLPNGVTFNDLSFQDINGNAVLILRESGISIAQVNNIVAQDLSPISFSPV